jgi:rubredoxin
MKTSEKRWPIGIVVATLANCLLKFVRPGPQPKEIVCEGCGRSFDSRRIGHGQADHICGHKHDVVSFWVCPRCGKINSKPIALAVKTTAAARTGYA